MIGDGFAWPIRISPWPASWRVFSPDGRRLAFTRAVEKAGKPQPPQLYLMTMDGGEARALTDIAKGAGSPVWSPDGRRLAFTSTANPEDLAKAARPGGSGEAGEERESDVRVITRATYRFNGRDFRLTDVEGQVLRDILA